jgi:hypothetical protein
MKTEVPWIFVGLFFPAIEDGWSNFPVSFENVENRIDIRSNFIPPAVVATPPPNKHSPMRIITVYGKSFGEEENSQKLLT